MKKEIILGIMIFALLASFGCASQRGNQEGVYSPDYNQGTKGLELSIMKNLPPDQLWKESEFVIGIEIKNSGSEDVENALITIGGYDSKYMSVSEYQRAIDLKGKQPGYPDGEITLLNFRAYNIGMPAGIVEYAGSFSVTSQYSYKTKASAEICINPDIYSIVEKQNICETKPVLLSGGQGAPVAITEINAIPSPRDQSTAISFTIKIANKDKGKVVGDIKIIDAKLSNQKITCPEKIEMSKEGQAIFICSAVLTDLRGAYLAPFNIEIQYDYSLSIDKKLMIIDPVLKIRKT